MWGFSGPYNPENDLDTIEQLCFIDAPITYTDDEGAFYKQLQNTNLNWSAIGRIYNYVKNTKRSVPPWWGSSFLDRIMEHLDFNKDLPRKELLEWFVEECHKNREYHNVELCNIYDKCVELCKEKDYPWGNFHKWLFIEFVATFRVQHRWWDKLYVDYRQTRGFDSRMYAALSDVLSRHVQITTTSDGPVYLQESFVRV